eukprot:433888-Pyramimonas_sp.AAC.1
MTTVTTSHTAIFSTTTTTSSTTTIFTTSTTTTSTTTPRFSALGARPVPLPPRPLAQASAGRSFRR